MRKNNEFVRCVVAAGVAGFKSPKREPSHLGEAKGTSAISLF